MGHKPLPSGRTHLRGVRGWQLPLGSTTPQLHKRCHVMRRGETARHKCLTATRTAATLRRFLCVCARTHTHTGAMERIREREKDFAWIDLEICRMPLFTPACCCCSSSSSSSSFSSASYSSFAPRARTCQCSSLRSPARTFSYSLVCSFHPGSREVPLTLASWSCLQRRRRRRRVVPSRIEMYSRARMHSRTHRHSLRLTRANTLTLTCSDIH
jgi:hypothetical protein